MGALQKARRGFTLMELLVVLAIMVLIAALSIPVIRSMLSDTRAIAAGDQVRARLAEARARAMEEGRPWRVGCLTGTGMIQIAPEESNYWDQTARDLVELKDLIRDELPPDVIFGTTMDSVSNQTTAGGGGGTWETIAVYLPQGNARDDATIYFGPMGFYPRRAVIRGLTGAVSIEDPDSRQLR